MAKSKTCAKTRRELILELYDMWQTHLETRKLEYAFNLKDEVRQRESECDKPLRADTARPAYFKLRTR